MPPNCSIGVTDGARTRDIQYHKLALYQLNYGHHVEPPVCHITAPLPRPDLGVASADTPVVTARVPNVAPPFTTDFVVS